MESMGRAFVLSVMKVSTVEMDAQHKSHKPTSLYQVSPVKHLILSFLVRNFNFLF